MMQPFMQLCLVAPLGRAEISSAMRSPEMSCAFSQVPAEKFFVARQPIDCVTLTRKAEPSASSAAMAGCEWMPCGQRLGGRLERGRVGDGDARAAGAVDDDRLELLGPHDGAEAAARGGAHVVVGRGDEDGGGLAAHLAGGAGADERDLVAVLLPETIDGVERAQALELRRRDELAAVGGDDEHRELVGLPGDLDAAQPELGQRPRGRAAGVGLFDAAGERALAADGQPAAVGDDRAGEDTGGDNERRCRGRADRPRDRLLG